MKLPKCPGCGQSDEFTIFPKNHPLLIQFDCCKIKIFKDGLMGRKE